MYVEYDKRKKEVLNAGAGRRERENELWEEYFSELKLVGLIALDDMIDLRVSITIDELQKNGIKYWMLTADDFDNALSNAFKQGIIKHNSHTMVLSGESESEVQNMLKYHIKSLSQTRKHEVNLALEKGVHRMIQNISKNSEKRKKNNILVLDSE